MKKPDFSQLALDEGFQLVRKKKGDVIDKIIAYEHTPIIVAATVGFLTGVIVGFIASPVKQGVKIASENEITSFDDAEDDEDDA